jgi:hypothetical protein
MVTKKKPSPKAKPRPKPQAQQPVQLKNLAARPTSFDDDEVLDEPLADASGVFRVTTAIATSQRGRDEDTTKRFADQSLVMAAQRDGFREDGPTLDDVVEDHLIEDETVRASKRQRLATLAARVQAQRGRR